ncbi:hypothetical protein [Hyphomicrobium sp.]|uniref:hypothetical protein n=1 Tax=Hyphomicrobium sp. TaxID=82 RepID=UPI001D2C20E5|nr:hypothetical protein [Hyphomicrobium sp.]MBY0558956.1 hypothetical protein [Hyphomicrobium sp.]
MSFAILLVIGGLAIMAFGLFLFYAWLPLFYGLVGFDIGLLLGRSLTGDIGSMAIIIGVFGALFLGGMAYSLEPYRRILLGISGGALFGLSLASLFNLDSAGGGFLGTCLAVVGGILGANIVPKYFDLFVICVSAFGGAVLIMAGAHLLLPGAGLFDRTAGGILPTLMTLALTAVGIGWQFRNIDKWVGTHPIQER